MADRRVKVVLEAQADAYIRGMEQAAQATERAADSAEKLGQSSEGVSASSEALFRMSGGLSGVASEADLAAMSFGNMGTGLDGLTTSFAEGLDLSMGFVDGMAQVALSAIGVVDGAREIGSEWANTSRTMQSDMTRVGTGFAAVGGAITAVYGSLLNTGIAYNTLQQVAGRALETMTGSASAAAEQMERLHAFADESPFARQTWITAQQQLMAFGMEAERVVPTLEGIQNAVAAIGGGDQEIMRLVDILGTVEGQGRITGRELQRLGQMGINAADLIGDAMGMTGNEIREQITAGALDAETAITALTEGMNSQFDGAAEGLRDTMEGALDRIRAAWRDLGGILAEPLVSPDGGGMLVELTNTAADLLRLVQQLSDPTLQTAGALAGLTGASLAAYGGLLLLVPQVVAFRDAKARLATEMPRTTSALQALNTTAKVLGGTLAALAIASSVVDYFRDMGREAPAMERALNNIAASGGHASDVLSGLTAEISVNAGFGSITQDMSDMDVAMGHLNRSWSNFGGLLNYFNGDIRTAREEWESLDSALGSMVASGSADQATAQMAEIAESALESGRSLEELADFMPQYVSALDGLVNQHGVAVSDAELLAWAFEGIEPAAVTAAGGIDFLLGPVAEAQAHFEEASGAAGVMREAISEVASQVDEAVTSLSNLVDELNAVTNMNLDAEAVMDNRATQMREFNELLQEEKDRLADLKVQRDEDTISQSEYEQAVKDTLITMGDTANGDKYRDMVREYAGGMLEAAAAAATFGEDLETVQRQLEEDIEAVIEMRVEAGESPADAEQWVRDKFGIPDHVSFEMWAETRAEQIQDEVNRSTSQIDNEFDLELQANLEHAQQQIDGFTNLDRHTAVRILGDDDIAQQVVWDFLNDEYIAMADIDGNTDPVAEVMAAFLNDDHETVAQIMGEDDKARDTMMGFLNDQWETTALIDGNDDSARNTMHGFTSFPWQTTATADADTWAAEADLNNLARTRFATIVANVQTNNAGTMMNSGGAIHGPGTGTSDDVPIMASNGEHVLTARDVQLMGGHTAVYQFRANLNGGQQPQRPSGREMMPAYAVGGAIAARQQAAAGIDYNRLAGALTGGGSRDVHVHIGSVNNPRGVPTEQSVKDALEYAPALGGGSFDD